MTGVATALQPEIVVQELFDDGDEVVVLEPDIWETVDVVPVALADAPFVIRSPSVRLDRAELRVDAPARTPPCVAPEAPHRAAADRARPPVVAGADATAADAARGGLEGPVCARTCWRCSRPAASARPPHSQLVGIYDRVPGGAIGSVAVDAGSLVIRLVPGRRARPTTLVVGRVKASQALVTVEISA